MKSQSKYRARFIKWREDWETRFEDWGTVHTTSKKKQRQGRLLAQFLIIFFIFITTVTLNNLLGWLLVSSQLDREYLSYDILAIIAFPGIWILNKHGHTVPAAHIIMFGSVIFGSLAYGIDNDGFVLVYLVLPIFLSSFILDPRWSFIFASISSIGYVSVHLIEALTYPFTIEAVLVFFTISAISNLSASILEEAIENSERSEAQYRELIERVPAVIYAAALDESKTRTYISPQIESMLGSTPTEYLNDPDLWKNRSTLMTSSVS